PLERFLAPAVGERTQAQARVHRLRTTSAMDDPAEVAAAMRPVTAAGARSAEDGEGAARDAEQDATEVGASLRAVAPAVQSFAAGRRR
ncbi:MAG: hypothetical protein ABSH36_14225, partial [Solirubrobacteraceae bacterium]